MMPITMNFWGEQALDFLQNALNMWNDKYNSILDILTTSPSEFQGGGIWGTVSDIITVIEGTGITLLVIFSCMGFSNPRSAIRISGGTRSRLLSQSSACWSPSFLYPTRWIS